VYGDKFEKISKTLADETRLLVFEDTAGNKELNSSAIMTMPGVTAATVSHPLKFPSHAGLIGLRLIPPRVEPSTARAQFDIPP
jgi:hypothetical protein